jgi:hypothetical protein
MNCLCLLRDPQATAARHLPSLSFSHAIQLSKNKVLRANSITPYAKSTRNRLCRIAVAELSSDSLETFVSSETQKARD